MKLTKEPPTPGELGVRFCTFHYVHVLRTIGVHQIRIESRATRVYACGSRINAFQHDPEVVVVHVSNYCPLHVRRRKRSAIKDMASNLERKWRKMLNSEVSEKMDTENAEGESCQSAL